jgi:eukaryotic-like serine/threonine-protein kinase
MAHPADDTLGAFVKRALAPGQMESITSHLESCRDCRDIVVAAVRAEAPRRFAHGTPSLPITIPKPRTPARQLGARVGRYELRSMLGAGGMGEVYEAHDSELDRAIALKVLRPGLAGDATTLTERLVRESRLMAKVAHPAVIAVHDVGRDGDTVFIAMELIRGETLGGYVARTTPTWREITSLYERAARGLAAAHAAGIVHRDFKPDNVLVELGRDHQHSRVVVTDFGIARLQGTPTEPSAASSHTGHLELTRTGTAVGTPAYMAPEQLAGETVDARADVFAFCISLWEGVFRERPFRGQTIDEIHAALAVAPRAPHTRVPARLVRALERGLARDPGDRWPDIGTLADELAAIVGRRKRVALAASALGLVGIGIAGALVIALGTKAAASTCPTSRTRLATAWDAARRAHIEQAFAATGLPYAAATVQHVEAALDSYGNKWVSMADDACRATHVTGEQSDEALDLRSECLRDRLAALRATTDVLATADHAVVDKAGRLVSDLTPIADCADIATLKRPIRPPADPARRAMVESIHDKLATARVMDRAGRGQDALADGRATLQLAQAAQDPQSVAAAESQLAGRYAIVQDPAAETTFEQAFVDAERANDDTTAIASAISLVGLVGDVRNRYADGLRWSKIADGLLDRHPDDLEGRSQLELKVAEIEIGQGGYKPALERLRHALALAHQRAASGEAADLDLAAIHMKLGDALRYVHDGDAVAEMKEALALYQRWYGPDHPQVALAHNGLSNALADLGRNEEAVSELRLAQASLVKTVAPTNAMLGMIHRHLAMTLIFIPGHMEEALAEARASLDAENRGPRDKAKDHQGVAIVLMEMHRFDEALAELLPQMAPLEAAMGKDDNSIAALATHIGEAYRLSKRCAQAVPYYQRAVVIDEKTSGPDDMTVAAVHGLIGRCEVDVGQFEPARAELERALKGLDASHSAEQREQTAEDQWALARALDGAHRDHAHAVELVRASRAYYASLPTAGADPTAESDLKQLDAWLAAHGATAH